MKPSAFNPYEIYQQIQISPSGEECEYFTCNSVASDGYAPRRMYRKEGFVCICFGIKEFEIGEGRRHFPISQKTSEVVTVGEWYCPFIFLKEKGGLDMPKEHLEQQWEEVGNCCTISGKSIISRKSEVTVHKSIRREEGRLIGKEEVSKRNDEEYGMVWFEMIEETIMEKMKMKWDQNVGDTDREKNLTVSQIFIGSGKGEWMFALYVLVERYELRRLDGSVVLTYAFRHSNQLPEKWEYPYGFHFSVSLIFFW
ncbi:hypothetical protein AMTRI_Chr10g230830 [Amborella trichopoda]